jgi:hypothetical protein
MMFFLQILTTGIYLQNTHIYRTTTGGASWFVLPTPSGGYAKVQFREALDMRSAAAEKIIKSTDAGASWIVQPNCY